MSVLGETQLGDPNYGHINIILFITPCWYVFLAVPGQSLEKSDFMFLYSFMLLI